jgi:hypothetical protein
MEQQTHKPHRPSKEKKKHAGGLYTKFTQIFSQTKTLFQIEIPRHSASQTRDDWQNLQPDPTM